MGLLVKANVRREKNKEDLCRILVLAGILYMLARPLAVLH